MFALCCAVFPMTAISAPGDLSVSSDQTATKASQLGQGVRGLVKSASGRPMPGIVVLAKSLDKPAPAIPDIAIVTNANGSYFWSLPPGNYELTFLRDGSKLAARRVVVRQSRVTQMDVLPARHGTPEKSR